jgi:SAM-dependent methyltransferase
MLDPAHRELVKADGFVAEPDGALLSHRLRFIRSEPDRANDMAGVYTDELTIPWNFVPVEKDVVDRVLSETPNDRHVLDLGCGFGKNAQYLATHRRQVSGIDIAADAVARMALEVPAASATRASADRLPFADETFDGVLDVGCLHSADVKVRQPAVREVARVLKAGRVLVSRIFRSRSAEWLAAQPFRTDGFGLEPEEAERLLLSGFTEVQVDVDPNFTILTARGRR